MDNDNTTPQEPTIAVPLELLQMAASYLEVDGKHFLNRYIDAIPQSRIKLAEQLKALLPVEGGAE